MGQNNQSCLQRAVWIPFVWLTLLLVPSISRAAIQSAATTFDAQGAHLSEAIETLALHNIQSTAKDIRRGLQALDPTHPVRLELLNRAKELVKQLDSPEYQVRENAFAELKELKILPPTFLEEAAKSKSLETAYRSRQIIAHYKSFDHRETQAGAIESACQVIISKRIRGQAEALLPLLDLHCDCTTREMIQQAILVSADLSDEEFLRKAKNSKNWLARKVSALALLKICPPSFREELKNTLIGERDDRVRLAIARSLANIGDRDCARSLVGLLRSKDVNIRVRANMILESFTGKRIGFVAYASLAHRDQKILKWNAWIETNLVDTDVNFPLSDSDRRVGRILYADFRTSRVTEVDTNGQKTWSKPVATAWDVQGLPNGNRLVSTHRNNAVVEFDSRGREAWKLELADRNKVMGLHRTPEGTTLVGLSRKVIEYDHKGNEVWSIDFKNRVSDCQRLSNGNTLIALVEQNEIIEVNVLGKIVWRLATDPSPMSVQRTDLGTTLVGTMGTTKIKEYSFEKKVVWELDTKKRTSVARRLPNGDTLVSSLTSVTLLTPDKSVRWEITGLKQSFGVSGF